MIAKPLVSVITCFYNEERFIEETIESVLNQNYTHWELILVDDGSVDRSTTIAKSYAGKYLGKIIYLEHDGHANKGLSASRNLGISQAKGELVAFLDADDVWTPEKLAAQVNVFTENSRTAMLCEASEYWYSWYNPEEKDIIIQVGKERDKIIEPPQLAQMLYPLRDGDAPCPSAIIVRKSVLNKVGGFEAHFTGKYQLYEDQAFLFKIYLKEPVYISSDCHNRYRQREGSLVYKVIKEGNYDVVRKYFLEWAQKYMENEGINQPKVKSLLNQALFPYHYPNLHLVLFELPGKGMKFFQKLFRFLNLY